MTRIEIIRSMTTREMAKRIIKLNVIYDYCKSDCEEDENCPHELECCIKWLEQEEQTKELAEEGQGSEIN